MTTPARDDLIRALPYARRYARALTGSQERGDFLVAETLRGLDQSEQMAGGARLALLAGVTQSAMRQSGGAGVGLPPRARALLLLTTLEELGVGDAARVVGVTEEEGRALLADARERLRAAVAADVLIIEDEPIIALDLEELVQACGHRVVGVAASEAEAVEIAARARPGLILADINLGSGGDGTHAVAQILRAHATPVIFVTAYPERLLTGEALEPAFVITKPFEPLTLAIATYQAVVGGVPLDQV